MFYKVSGSKSLGQRSLDLDHVYLKSLKGDMSIEVKNISLSTVIAVWTWLESPTRTPAETKL